MDWQVTHSLDSFVALHHQRHMDLRGEIKTRFVLVTDRRSCCTLLCSVPLFIFYGVTIDS